MKALFYNGGRKIEERWPYSGAALAEDSHAVSYYVLTAPEESFFEVPTELTAPMTGERIPVNFVRDIITRHGERGVIQVDPEYTGEGEDADTPERYPFARTREEAIVKGDKFFRLYLEKIVRVHIEDCEKALSAGGAPRSAIGFTKFAFQKLGITDPGEKYFNQLKNNEVGPQSGLQAQVSLLASLVGAMISGGKVDPDLVKSALSPAQIPVTAQTQVMTGPKPMKEPDGPAYGEEVKAEGRSARAKKAQEALQEA